MNYLRLFIERLEPRRLLASASFAVIGDYGDSGPADEDDDADSLS